MNAMKSVSQAIPPSIDSRSFEKDRIKEDDTSERVLTIPILRLPHANDLPLPKQATPNSSGLDLQAAIASELPFQPRQRMLIPTGFSIALPPGFEAQIRPRSGLACDHGITVLNAPGTIDADYRGEIRVLLIHHGDETFTITPGMRIAQLVIAPLERIMWRPSPVLDKTERGKNGFGSTGS